MGNQRDTPADLEGNSTHVVNCTWEPWGKALSNLQELKEVPGQQLEGKMGTLDLRPQELILPITSDVGDNGQTPTIITTLANTLSAVQ